MTSFTVETRDQGAVIIGGNPGLVQDLIKEFGALNILATKIASLAELKDFNSTHDADYLVIFQDQESTSRLEQGGGVFQSHLLDLINSGESRLFVIKHPSWEGKGISLSPITRTIAMSDYVSQDYLFSPYLNTVLAELTQNHTLCLPGDGLLDYSLLDQVDLVSLLSKLITKPVYRKGETLHLGNPNPISLLNLAYLIRTSLPFKIELMFNQDSAVTPAQYDKDLYLDTLSQLNYQLNGSPEDKLAQYLKTHSIQKPKTPPVNVVAPEPKIPEPPKPSPANHSPVKEALRQPPLAPPVKKLTPLKTNQPVFVPLQSKKFNPASLFSKKSTPSKRRLPRIPLIVGRGLVIALSLYLGSLAFAFTLTSLSLKQIALSLGSGSLPNASPLNLATSTYLSANYLALTSLAGLSANQTVKEAGSLLDAYNQTLVVLGVAGELSHTTQTLTNYIFGTGDADIAQAVSLGRLQAEDLYQKLSLLDGSLPQEPPAVIPEKHHAKYQDSKNQLQKIRRSITTTKALLATTPDVIGIGGKRKYAVLFQNNMELRATGGFIGSFAILNFENGKLYDMPIYDVYDADGQLKGHVEPPAPIKEILGEASWYLRDSNFDPDFPSSARRAEWFIKKSLNQDLDGTIAVTVNTLVSLLKATGPIEVPDYNETISENNLYERAQFHAEVNFFPGSTQKKEFLSTVANTLFAKLPTLDPGEGLKLVSALSETVQEKNTLISLINPTTDYVFETLNWNGQISDLPCPSTDNCHKDYAMVVDSNFGVNKANYFIKRDIEEVITFDKNLAVNHVLRLNYQNTSTSTAWPAGAYKNYQRVYLPVGANVTSVKIGNTTLSPDQYTLSSEHGKFIIAYLVTVPINSNQLVELEYTTPQLSQGNELLYTWYWQKQPGTSSEDNLVVYLNYPMYLRPTVISPQSELAPQQLKFNMQNDMDRRITVRFQR